MDQLRNTPRWQIAVVVLSLLPATLVLTLLLASARLRFEAAVEWRSVIYIAMYAGLGILLIVEIRRRWRRSSGRTASLVGYSSTMAVALIPVVMGVTTGFAANNIYSFWKTLEPSVDEFYTNADKARLSSQVIRMTLLDARMTLRHDDVRQLLPVEVEVVSTSDEALRRASDSLAAIAEFVEDWWPKLAQGEGFEDERALVADVYDKGLEDYLVDPSRQALDGDRWGALLATWTAGSQAAPLPDAIREWVIDRLASTFGLSLREAFKAAYVAGDEAHAAMVLDASILLAERARADLEEHRKFLADEFDALADCLEVSREDLRKLDERESERHRHIVARYDELMRELYLIREEVRLVREDVLKNREENRVVAEKEASGVKEHFDESFDDFKRLLGDSADDVLVRAVEPEQADPRTVHVGRIEEPSAAILVRDEALFLSQGEVRDRNGKWPLRQSSPGGFTDLSASQGGQYWVALGKGEGHFRAFDLKYGWSPPVMGFGRVRQVTLSPTLDWVATLTEREHKKLPDPFGPSNSVTRARALRTAETYLRLEVNVFPFDNDKWGRSINPVFFYEVEQSRPLHIELAERTLRVLYSSGRFLEWALPEPGVPIDFPARSEDVDEWSFGTALAWGRIVASGPLVLGTTPDGELLLIETTRHGPPTVLFEPSSAIEPPTVHGVDAKRGIVLVGDGQDLFVVHTDGTAERVGSVSQGVRMGPGEERLTILEASGRRLAVVDPLAPAKARRFQLGNEEEGTGPAVLFATHPSSTRILVVFESGDFVEFEPPSD